MDGTFNIVPRVYGDGQMFSLHANYNGMTLPIFYSLMKTKERAQYRRIFEEIRRSFPEFDPQKVMLDLELMSRDALKDVFPRSSVSLCFYHFQEAHYSWLCQHGMKTRYSTDESFRQFIHMHGALAFLPPTP